MKVRDFLLNSFDFDNFGNKDIFLNIGSSCFNLIANEKNRSSEFNQNQIKTIVTAKGDCEIKSWKIIPELGANGMYQGLSINIEL